MALPFSEATTPALLPDIVRVGHLLSVSLATGLVCFLNFSLLKRWFVPMQVGWVIFHLRAQEFVIGAALFAWISGNMMLWHSYRLDSLLFPDAMWVKLVLVKALFLSALYSRLRLPKILRSNAGLIITELPFRARFRVAFAAGLSLTCWIGTFLISASRIVQDSHAALAMEVVLATMLVFLGGFVLLAVSLRSPASNQRLRTARRIAERHFEEAEIYPARNFRVSGNT